MSSLHRLDFIECLKFAALRIGLAMPRVLLVENIELEGTRSMDSFFQADLGFLSSKKEGRKR